MLRDTTPDIRDFPLWNNLNLVSSISDAHAGHTQNLNCIETQFSQVIMLHYLQNEHGIFRQITTNNIAQKSMDF